MSTAKKIERNDPCSCGSGIKYKKCCLNKPKRKFISEFGLHTYSSHATIFYPNDMKKMKFERDYHIYMIHLVPKLRFVEETLIVTQDSVSVGISVKTEAEEHVELFQILKKSEYDYTKLTIEFDKPLKTISIINEKGHGSRIRALPLYLKHTKNPLDCEILYVGQSYGTDGNRYAKDRLKAHSTLQQILADIMFDEPVRDVAISMWEFTPRLLATFDGISNNYLTSEENDNVHMMNVLNSPQSIRLNNQMITITEAALINYFKPEYNDKYVNNFPDPTHVYKDYYNLDYNSLVVELDTDTIGGNLFSKKRYYQIYEPIEYNLHFDETRRSMFDMFEEKKGIKEKGMPLKV
ncbi:YecA family protein [Paenibacillus sp. NPDC056722]|uniref:YecA family protein n=1 Tax=Paenibacillus sp. NPDC056722 TaxID=3345924 RepID=UPI00368D9F64